MDFSDESDGDESQHQACHVLHTGYRKNSETGKGSNRMAGRKRQNKDVAEWEHHPRLSTEAFNHAEWRLPALQAVWGRIQKIFEDVVEDQSQGIYEEIQQWICNRQYGDAQLELCLNSTAVPSGFGEAGKDILFPLARTVARRQLHTALLFLGGIDPSDHLRTIDGLHGHLQSHQCHIARLTSVDFSLKGGIVGPLRVLFKQLIQCNPETTDMEILKAWHSDVENHGRPVVIVVENAESCESRILAEFITLLSDWIGEIPMVLVMEMATTGEAVRKLLPASALVRLRLWRFRLKAPPELLEVVLRAVMIDSFCAFELCHEVVAFMYGIFQGHDLSVTAIGRAFKVAAVEHFWKEPLSILCWKVLKANSKAYMKIHAVVMTICPKFQQMELENECSSLPEELLDRAAGLPSVARQSSQVNNDQPLSVQIAESLWRWRTHKKMWAMAFSCLQTVGRKARMGFAELLLEALSGSFTARSEGSGKRCNGLNGLEFEKKHCHKERVMSKLRDMPAPTLKSVLEDWRRFTIHEKELNADVCRLLSDFDGAKEKIPCSPDSAAVQAAAKQDFTIRVMNRSKLRMLGQQRSLASQRTGVHAVRTAAEELLQNILTKFLVPSELQRFNEIYCFKNVKAVREALIGDTRGRVHQDLLNSRELLNCKCCPINGMLAPSQHDTTLAYSLSQEYGDLIHVQTWFQAFAALFDPVRVSEEGADQKGRKGRGRKKQSDKALGPLPDNAAIEARFTRAATDLHIAGLLQLPKKGQSDSVRRLCI